jgi:hypothetical protein
MVSIVPVHVASVELNGNSSGKLSWFARNCFSALIVSVLLLTAGCATEPKVLPAWTFPQLPSPRVAPLPITVGVHYTEAFQRKRHEDKHDRNKVLWYEHDPGGASVALFDSVFSATFEKVVRIPTWPPAGGAEPEVDFVLLPSVSRVSTTDVNFPIFALTRTITYEIKIFTAGGALLHTWEVDGNGAGSWISSHETFTALALRDAAARLLIGLRERPPIRTRLSTGERARVTAAPDETLPGINGIAVLPGPLDDPGWANCMKDALERESVPVIEGERFRDATFPWFEPSLRRPRTADGLAQWLNDPLVRRSAIESGARYVLFVGGATSNEDPAGPFFCGGSYPGAGCFGVMSGKRVSSMNLTLADFARREMAGEINSSESGSSTWVGFILPIPIISATETAACHKAAVEVRKLVESR